MGLARDAFRTVTLAATAGLAVGGVLGVLAPTFAEAGPAAPHAAAASGAAARVTSFDLLGTVPNLSDIST